jgi:hypothetical protein
MIFLTKLFEHRKLDITYQNVSPERYATMPVSILLEVQNWPSITLKYLQDLWHTDTNFSMARPGRFIQLKLPKHINRSFQTKPGLLSSH